jgi:hypothetical protein
VLACVSLGLSSELCIGLSHHSSPEEIQPQHFDLPQRLSGSVFFRLKQYMSSFYTSIPIPSAGCADDPETIALPRMTDLRPFIHY